MKATVNFNGTISEPFPIESGVKQDDVLAPRLFALYFAVFMTAFKDNAMGVYIRYRTTGKLFFNIRRLKANPKVAVALIRDLLYADYCPSPYSRRFINLVSERFDTKPTISTKLSRRISLFWGNNGQRRR